MIQPEQEQVLCKIADLFEQQDVIWALGGPMLLCKEEIVQSYSVIDILIMPEYIQIADSLLSTLGKKHPRVPMPVYVSQFFHAYTIDNIQVNLISGMTLHHKGFLFRYPFDRQAIVSMHHVQNIYIPCTAPEDWWVMYQMMPNRAPYFEAVDRYFCAHGLRYPARLEKMRQQMLPPAVLAGMKQLLGTMPKQQLASV